ncbi:PEP/pyruvate-binding domain-containing protein [Rudanella lutea]|uniref:PEP/pyruvate-binding domain-containing protein n=1 Tax=Rudanella lutea TaxID=451374 RepID=UPI00036EEACB|nr:PEP/pyruvate-binding domain-containing protein [Rudanella lutea]
MKYTLFFKEAQPEDYPLLGGKGASLASMSAANLPVPVGFCVTTHAYSAFLHASDLFDTIMAQVEQVDCANVAELDRQSAEIRALILDKPLPAEVESVIRSSYRQLCDLTGLPGTLPVAVRSSATAEDLPDASFAGQQDTYLWVVGEDEVIEHVRRCWASLYTARAINYRRNGNIPENDVLMSVVVQKMVNARTAGVAMTLNPTNGDRSKIVIDASWGLGEAVVSGEVTPDNFLVDKVMLEIIKADIQHKAVEHVPDRVNRRVITRDIEPDRAAQPCLSDDEVKAVCRIAKTIEKHYRCPQDIEWALDADLPDGENFTLLQSRPETVWTQKKATTQATTKTGMEGILNTLMNPLAARQ